MHLQLHQESRACRQQPSARLQAAALTSQHSPHGQSLYRQQRGSGPGRIKHSIPRPKTACRRVYAWQESSFRPSRQQPGTLRIRTKPEGSLLDAPSSPRDVQGSKLVQRMTESDAALMLGGDLLVTIFEASLRDQGLGSRVWGAWCLHKVGLLQAGSRVTEEPLAAGDGLVSPGRQGVRGMGLIWACWDPSHRVGRRQQRWHGWLPSMLLTAAAGMCWSIAVA